ALVSPSGEPNVPPQISVWGLVRARLAKVFSTRRRSAGAIASLALHVALLAFLAAGVTRVEAPPEPRAIEVELVQPVLRLEV
ncbi:hypothetical protein, partial [Klebsiella pneumoniae]|uniref:hypothetical protein n=1 Tax=Klebsiella pneumoniae TaxID=573 RepID=UPI0013D638EE